MKERIICSAIWYQTSDVVIHQPINITHGFVVCGHRHHNCYMTVGLIAPNNELQKINDMQGFLTNTNKFVSREEGLEIARDANQMLEKSDSAGKRLLYSEDLY